MPYVTGCVSATRRPEQARVARRSPTAHRRNAPPPQLLVLACLAVCALWPSPTRAAAAGSAPDIPPALAFGPQLAWPHRIRSQPVPGQTLTAFLPGSLRAYRASRWRWRRAASPRPLPQDVETVASPDMPHYRYVIQPRDAGHFLSACIQLRVTRDIVSEYCRPFIGPVLSPCAADIRPAEANLPPLRVAPARGRWHLLPALDGRHWREPVALLPWPAGGWAVAERAGRILRHRPGQTPCLLLDLTAAIGPLGSENGLLSLARDPQFPTAPFLYVYYTRAQRSRLARFAVADGYLHR